MTPQIAVNLGTTLVGRDGAAALPLRLSRRVSPLARRLSTASYFASVDGWCADQCVIDAGGFVGRHLADGVVAFSSPRPPERNPPRLH
jgi:hypothetical protein